MKQKSNLSKMAKVATGAAFLFFCLLNLKTVVKNNGKFEKSESNVVMAADPGCPYNPKKNWGDCQRSNLGNYYFCVDSWFWHDCYASQS